MFIFGNLQAGAFSAFPSRHCGRYLLSWGHHILGVAVVWIVQIALFSCGLAVWTEGLGMRVFSSRYGQGRWSISKA